MNNHDYLKEYVSVMKKHGLISKNEEDLNKFKHFKNPKKQEWIDYLNLLVIEKNNKSVLK